MTAALVQRLRETAPDHLRGEEEVLARVRVLSSGGRLTLPERDRLVYELVLLYREGPRERWAPVLLEVMAPPIFQRFARFRPQEPAIDSDDVLHQFLLEVLEAALRLPVKDGPAWLERRLVLGAAGRVSRWLRREARYRELLEPLAEPADEEDSHDCR